MRLPLKPVGLHSAEDPVPDVIDPVDAAPLPVMTFIPPSPTITPLPQVVSLDPIEMIPATEPALVGVSPLDEVPDRPVVDNGGEKEKDKGDNFWDYVSGKVDDFKEWLGGVIGGVKGDGNE